MDEATADYAEGEIYDASGRCFCPVSICDGKSFP